MSVPIRITMNDPRLKTLTFKPYRSKEERRVIPFLPGPDESQTMEIETSWGEILTVRRGGFLASEVDMPDKFIPINPEIFEETYTITRPGYGFKKTKSLLVPMVDLTNGNPDQLVEVETLEGTLTVRAGDFYLAMGIQGEIWPFPRENLEKYLIPLDEDPSNDAP